MTEREKRAAAREFHENWRGRGKEKQDDQSYWIEFCQNVLGIEGVTNRIEWQKEITQPNKHPGWIDGYIYETKTLIEQKSFGIPLDKPQKSHNGMTPYEQAKFYDNCLPQSQKAKWIVLSNFAEIWVYDMDTDYPEPKKYDLDEIQAKYNAFYFLFNKKTKKISEEVEISVKAGDFVGLIYDAFHKEYKDPDSDESLKSLNMLCVRLVFCLYAEDAHIFGEKENMFHDYMEQFKTEDMRDALIVLFKKLNDSTSKKDDYDNKGLNDFPYVNGGLFADENIVVPQFTDEIRNILLSKASEGFNWSNISPTIFGAVFESTLNPETRRSGGMHYTSVENIHKVIDPLFLDELKLELAQIKDIKTVKTRNDKLRTFQDKLASLTWLDPACGSGNFLTETYISIRRLENEVIKLLFDSDKKQVNGQITFADANINNPIKVNINQFYGIEVNDFAVTVAKTALWIAESQMMKDTEDILLMPLPFLPLTTQAHIDEGNALTMDWNEVISNNSLNYIMGNPPFVGARLMSKVQKSELKDVFGKKWKNAGNLDYVCCWYKKAVDYMTGTKIVAALVSTNSVSQGETVANLWKPLFEEGCHIDFAHRTFRWDSEAHIKAHVHCVIIGFSIEKNNKQKKIFTNNNAMVVDKINAYLINADNTFIESRKTALCDVPEMVFGNMANDNGNFILSEEEKNELIQKEPLSEKYIRAFMGANEFIKAKKRYCLWLKNANPSDLKQMPDVMKRINAVKEIRENSSREATRKLADIPSLFGEIRQPEQGNYLLIPRVSSEKRRYVPMGFLDCSIIASDAVQIVPNAGLYHFGILESNIHMEWMRTVAGRLEMRYRYSANIVYNNFPWPTPTDAQKKKIEQTAQSILDARALYPESSLADLYDPLTMPSALLHAHYDNNRAVMEAYNFSTKLSEDDSVAELMKMYQELITK